MKHYLAFATVWLLIVATVFCAYMIFTQFSFEERVASVVALLIFSVVCWAASRPCSNDDFDVMG